MRREATTDDRSNSDSGSGGVVVEDKESREVLDAFFIGKALAETLLERAGGLFADTLGEIAKFDAERREEIREFQDDVMGKAREEMYRARREEDQMR